MPKGKSQADVNAIVAKWIKEHGIPEGKSVGEFMFILCEWADLRAQQDITYPTLGYGLNAQGLYRKRVKGRMRITAKKPR